MSGEVATQGRVEEACTYLTESAVGRIAEVRFKDRRTGRTRAVRAKELTTVVGSTTGVRFRDKGTGRTRAVRAKELTIAVGRTPGVQVKDRRTGRIRVVRERERRVGSAVKAHYKREGQTGQASETRVKGTTGGWIVEEIQSPRRVHNQDEGNVDSSSS